MVRSYKISEQSIKILKWKLRCIKYYTVVKGWIRFCSDLIESPREVVLMLKDMKPPMIPVIKR